MSELLLEELQFIKGLDPVADAFDSTVYSDVVNMSKFERVVFAVYVGVGATGTSTLTVQACDDTTPSNRSAVPFYYREITTGDTEGAITAAAAAGFTTTPGSSKLVLVEVREDALASSGYGYVQLKAVESANSPVLAGILVIGEAKIESALKASAIV
jgi:hypothetical protein